MAYSLGNQKKIKEKQSLFKVILILMEHSLKLIMCLICHIILEIYRKIIVFYNAFPL